MPQSIASQTVLQSSRRSVWARHSFPLKTVPGPWIRLGRAHLVYNISTGESNSRLSVLFGNAQSELPISLRSSARIRPTRRRRQWGSSHEHELMSPGRRQECTGGEGSGPIVRQACIYASSAGCLAHVPMEPVAGVNQLHRGNEMPCHGSMEAAMMISRRLIR